MKRAILSLFLAVTLAVTTVGCATTPTGPPLTAAQQSVTSAQQYVYAVGTALKATPQVVDALYNAGKVTKDDYNKQILPVYNQALGSYWLLVSALDIAVSSGQNPADVTAYQAALAKFLTDKDLVDKLILAFGGTPAVAAGGAK